jgi:hypothetical protein
MAENEKQLSPEEAQKEAEAQRALDVKKTLESKFLQKSIGTNHVRSNQGLWGEYGAMAAESVYNEAMNSPDAAKERKTLQDVKLAEYKKYSVFGEAFIPNSDISLKLAKQLEQVLGFATFGEIEKYSKDIGAKLNFRVPEDMKGLSLAKILASVKDKEKGIINLGNLSGVNKEAYTFYENILSKVYERACAVDVMKGADYFADLNAQALQFGEKYALPKEEPKDKDNSKGKEGK